MTADPKLMSKSLQEHFKQYSSFMPYVDSFNIANKALIFIANIDDQDMLVINGNDEPVFDKLSGIQSGDMKICPLNHENRLVINSYLPFTKPVALGRNNASLGLGDRLGLANYAHLQALKGSDIKPVLAQQSLRELSLTGRTYDDVLDTAAWAVLKSGWHDGYAADGDHLKHEEDIAAALSCGYTMITLDCSDLLIDTPKNAGSLYETYHRIPQITRGRIEKEYLNSADAKLIGIEYDMQSLMQIAVTYNDAISFAANIYYNYISKAGRPIDFELSLDETSQVTTLAAHYFVANELNMSNVYLTSLAPRFIGEFQKAIDYIGNPIQFESNLHNHAQIADHFGYKLSIHSGSDKFSIYPFINPQTNGRFHVKTSGTSWLEAVRVIAEKEPQLYRDMHKCALLNFSSAKAYYVVHADINNIEPIEKIEDKDLNGYLLKDDSRQLLHISYGFILADKALKNRLFKALNSHRKSYEDRLRKHIGKHISLLKNP